MNEMDKYFDSVKDWFKDKEHEEIKKCLICEEEQAIVENDIATCKTCGFVWRFRAPTQATLDKFYEESEAMKQWADIKQTDKEKKRQLEKYEFIYEQAKEINAASILDVGCGNGFFLNNCVTKAKKVGIEPNAEAAKYCKFPVYDSFESFNNSLHSAIKYDLITFFGVVEHLKDPMSEIKRYSQFLAPKGLISIIVPNVESLVIKTLGHQASTFCPQHLWYFSFTSLSSMMFRCGFEYGYGTTVEAETQPILKKLNGLDPYSKLEIINCPKEFDEGIISNLLGYKLQTFFSREVI